MKKTASKQELLNSAIESLVIQQVSIREVHQIIDEAFEPGVTETSLSVAFRGRCMRFKTMEVNTGPDSKSTIVRYQYECGMVLMDTSRPCKEVVDNLSHETLARLDVLFVADYFLKNLETSKEALEVFGHQNAGYHIWPYWREYVQSQTARSMLPTIAVPFYQKPPLE